MIFFSCRFAPNRRSISIKNTLSCACCTRLGTLRPRRLSNESCRFVQTTLRLFLLAKYSSPRQAGLRPRSSPLPFLVRGHSPRARKGCSARAARGQAPIREADRVWPRPLLCIPNNWERSGRRPAEKERWRLCKTAGDMWPCSSSSTASLHGGKNLHNLGIQLGKLQRQYAFAGM
jgi:hypothetical protein